MTPRTQAIENALHVALGETIAAEESGELLPADADVIRDGVTMALTRLALAEINGSAS